MGSCARVDYVRFNTQPPEGGWSFILNKPSSLFSFNTQPPEGGWSFILNKPSSLFSFNTQPPEGGWNSA